MRFALARCISISIHAPREGSDVPPRASASKMCYFYPRSPRGERRPARTAGCPGRNFYPRSPRGERPDLRPCYIGVGNFYPRSPRGERRGKDRIQVGRDPHFYPRSPRGERPARRPPHRTGVHFYPRSPRGERPGMIGPMPILHSFLSTLPARGATVRPVPRLSSMRISIHAPREGSDQTLPTWTPLLKQYFYPRSPRGERLDYRT